MDEVKGANGGKKLKFVVINYCSGRQPCLFKLTKWKERRKEDEGYTGCQTSRERRFRNP